MFWESFFPANFKLRGAEIHSFPPGTKIFVPKTLLMSKIWRGHGGVSPGPPSPSKRREQERAAIIHGTCRGRMPPTVPARSLLCGGADVLACKIRFSPEIEATRNGWCAWARCGRGCHGRNPCGLGSIKPDGRGVRAQRCGHLVLFRTKSRPRPRCGSPVPDMSRNKRGYLQGSPTTATAAFKDAAY